MDHFYLTLPSYSSGYYIPANTIADFRTKLATPLELEHGKLEDGLIEISYPRGHKKRSLHNSLCLVSEEITFPVKHYESVFHLLTKIPRFHEPSIKENYVRTFNKYINKYQKQSEDLFNSCRGENSIMIDENLLSYFHARAYNDIDDLAETIMNPANRHSSTVNLSTKDNFNFTQPEGVYIYTDIINPNLVGNSYVR